MLGESFLAGKQGFKLYSMCTVVHRVRSGVNVRAIEFNRVLL